MNEIVLKTFKMVDIYSRYIGLNERYFIPRDSDMSSSDLSFLYGCYAHNLDEINEYIDKIDLYRIIQGLKCVLDSYSKPTCVDALRRILDKNPKVGIAALKILSNINGGSRYYRDLYLLCLMYTTSEEINRTNLLVLPGNIRKFNIEQLLMFGADVNMTNINGETPLMMACKYGTKEMVSLLINAGAKIHTENNKGEDCKIYGKFNIFYEDIVSMLEIYD